MTKQNFYTELESMLEIEHGTIQGNELLVDLPGWDSMAVISFIALADDKMGEAISAGTLAACRSVGDLVNLFHGRIT